MSAVIINLQEWRRTHWQKLMWEKFKAWLASPFKEGMSAFDWFLFLGLLIVLTAIWGFILRHLRKGME